MSDPTKVKPLSTSFPLCVKHKLVLQYKMEYGPHVDAELVEALLNKFEKKIFKPSPDFPGRPQFFDPDAYLDCVEQMINADEVLRAILLLDNFPAFYRDNPPIRALEIRARLHQKLFTPVQYRGIYKKTQVEMKYLMDNWPPRAQLMEQLVKKYNEQGIKPNIMELAPGPFWLPIGLQHKGLKFTYEHLSLDDGDPSFERPGDTQQANVFCAFELIEHLHYEAEIYQNYLKFNKTADVIMMSTPRYTFNGGEDKWFERDLGHLRTYTPHEFLDSAAGMFRGYKWEAYVDHCINIIGRKNAST